MSVPSIFLSNNYMFIAYVSTFLTKQVRMLDFKFQQLYYCFITIRYYYLKRKNYGTILSFSI